MSVMPTTHRDILRRLSTDEKRALMVRSDLRGLLHLAGHLGLIGLCLWGNVAGEGALRWLAMVGQGIAMVFLFTAMHECSHATAFRSRWLNRVIGNMAGMVLLIAPRWFFYFHQDHHKFTQDPDRDPELASPKPQGIGGYLLYLSGVPFWVGNLRVLLGNAAGRRKDVYVPEVKRGAVIREARWMLAAWAAIAGTLAMAGWLGPYLLLPLLFGQPFLRACLLAEHAGCAEGDDNMLVNSRTLLTTPPLRFLAWNMPFHAEHHSFPAVPFHALPRLHQVMKGDIGTLEPGYLGFHRGFLAKARQRSGDRRAAEAKAAAAQRMLPADRPLTSSPFRRG